VGPPRLWSACGPPVVRLARLFFFFSRRLQFSACKQKRAPSSRFFPPFAHTTRLLNSSSIALPHLRWKFSPSIITTARKCNPVSQPASASDQSRPSTPFRHSAVSAPSPELKPAPPLPKPAPYEYGHSSSQPQPESSSTLLRSPSLQTLHRLSTVTSHSSALQNSSPLEESSRIPTQHPTSQYKTQKLFMYQHDKIPVHRHSDPPLKLQLFRNPRKPCSPNPSPDG
jgi:hypothetical protein